MITKVNQNRIYSRQYLGENCLHKQKRAVSFGNNPNTSTTRTSIFYINDYHGKASNMVRTVNASNMFDSFESAKPTDKLKLASGDILIGEDVKPNQVAMKFLDFIGVTATALGNHECDMTSKNFMREAPNMPAKMLACNIKSAKNCEVIKFIDKSCIQEVNGTKYGIIGVLPPDLVSRIKFDKAFEDQDIIPADLEETISLVQAEVNKLKEQGINKIILLSHCGYDADKEIAQKTEGIDVIHGGHSHNLLKDIKKGTNLFYSKTGEPVIITQAGRDGKNFGILNLEFDNNGTIIKAQNNIGTTRDFSKNLVAENCFEKITGKPKIVGTIRTPSPKLENDLIDINPLAYYGTDAIREKANSEISLVGAGNLRGYLEKGEVSTLDIDEISPFKNKIIKADYTEKDLVEAIRICAKSLTNPDGKPGLMYASGLEYTINKEGELLNMTFVDKAGNKTPIDVNNPRADKIYSVAINDYSSRGNDGLTMLNKYDKATEKYDWDITVAIREKIEKTKQPIDIIDDGRIKIV